jgi:multimeric flavodoxin WrbA
VDYELVSLRKKTISGCIACLGCVKDNVCKVEDDLTPLREKIVEADAYVFGAPNYYSTLNAATHALLERWFQFRHQTGNPVGQAGRNRGRGRHQRPLSGRRTGEVFSLQLHRDRGQGDRAGSGFLLQLRIRGDLPGGHPLMMHGEGVKITPEMIPDVGKQPKVMAAAESRPARCWAAAEERPRSRAVTANMQKKMMAMFASAA